mmetsp:Transcript_11632/g.49697  ORF Transcript_11632/g.49697 Transcript_11632/m.49697 type:complete len:232 (-) Transcript_11632:1658-2353(-)
MFLVSTISRVNCSRMSWNLEDIVRPIAPELSTRSNDESRSNASSAERSFLNDWSTNALADFSTSSRSRSKSDTTTCQSANRFGSKMSNSTLRAARAMSVTRLITSSIASGSPVTVLSLPPRNRWKPCTASSICSRSPHTEATYSVLWNKRLRSNSQRLSLPDFSIFSRIAMYESRQVFRRRFASRTRDSAVAASTAKTPVAGFLASATSEATRPISSATRPMSPPMRVSSP